MSKETELQIREQIATILNEPIVRAKYGKCPHCSFKTKSYIVRGSNAISKHIEHDHPEIPLKVDKLILLFNSLTPPKGLKGKI